MRLITSTSEDTEHGFTTTCQLSSAEMIERS